MYRKVIIGLLALGITPFTLVGCEGDDGRDGAVGPAGADGLTSIIVQSELGLGDANCPAGGTRVESGLDSNRNALLDATEVSDISYVCNAATDQGDTDVTQLNGRVTIQTGEPIGNARVVAMNRKTHEKFQTTTALDGTYSLEVPWGYYDIGADDTRKEHITIEGPVTAGYRELTIDTNVHNDAIYGSVVLADGSPAGGYQLKLVSNYLHVFPEGLERDITLDAEGTFYTEVGTDFLLDIEVFSPEGEFIEHIDVHKGHASLQVSIDVGSTEDDNVHRHTEVPATASALDPMASNVVDVQMQTNKMLPNNETVSTSDSYVVDPNRTTRIQPLTTVWTGSLAPGSTHNVCSNPKTIFTGRTATGVECVGGAEDPDFFKLSPIWKVESKPKGGYGPLWFYDYQVVIYPAVMLLPSRPLYDGVYIMLKSTVWYFTDGEPDRYQVRVDNILTSHSVSYDSTSPNITKIEFDCCTNIIGVHTGP